MRRLRIVASGLACCLLVVAPPAAAQQFSGRVVEAGSGRPIAEALVELVGARRVTLVDRGGRFVFEGVEEGVDSLRITRQGYASLAMRVRLPIDRDLVFELERDPIPLEGVGAEVPTFEESYGALEQLLDMRIGQWPGRTKVAEIEDLREYDDAWDGDPWAFLHNGPLEVYSHRGSPWVKGYGLVVPEVWIDDRRWWLQAYLLTPNESLCRVEVYTPSQARGFRRIRIEPPVQLRAYTCAFMGRVAAGLEEICPDLEWGTLVSGPDGDGSGTSIRAEEGRELPRGPGPQPIDLGPGLDISPNTIGVGSGACGKPAMRRAP